MATKTSKLLCKKKISDTMLITGILLYCPEYGVSKDADQTSPSLVPTPSHHLSLEIPRLSQCLSVAVQNSTRFLQCPSFAAQNSPRLLQCPLIAAQNSPRLLQCPLIAAQTSPRLLQCPLIAAQNSPRLLYCKRQILQRPGKEATFHTHHTSSFTCRPFPFFHGSSSCSVHHCQFAKLETKRGLGMRLGGCGNLLCRSSQGLVIIVKDTVS